MRLLCMLERTFLVALIAPGFLAAQQPPPGDAPPVTQPALPDAVGTPLPSNWTKMSVKEKFRYDARHLFELDNIIFAGMGAALDQERDRPGAWGEGWGPYFERYASHLGQYAVQRSIAFGVQAVDHEDARYFRSTKTTLGGRVADAFLHTVWRHDDSGGMMPAYSEFFGDYGAAALSRYLWWPQRFHNGKAVFIAGSDTILIDAGINLFHEFTPDIKRRLHLGR